VDVIAAGHAFALQEWLRKVTLRGIEVPVAWLLMVVLRVALLHGGEVLGDWGVSVLSSKLGRRHNFLTLDLLTFSDGLTVGLLGQGLDELGLLEELADIGLKHAAQLIRSRLRQTHAIEEVVFIGKRKFTIRGELKVHLCIVLRDLDPAVRLALDEEERQLELLVRVSD